MSTILSVCLPPLFALCAAASQDSTTPTAPPPAAAPLPTRAQVDAAIDELGSTLPGLVKVEEIGRSVGGVPIRAMTVSVESSATETKPGILIVAGLDAHHRSSSQAVLATLRSILADNESSLPDMHTLYVVPLANPDAFDARVNDLEASAGRNARPLDDDRDGVADEDAPKDLDSDGVITSIRRGNIPPSEGTPTWMADAVEPRLMRKPDAAKGEAATFAIGPEAIDVDGDGLLGEDGPGGCDPDRNFPARWKEFDVLSGSAPLSEPEAMALAQFVHQHPNIGAVLVVGRQDTLVKAPDSSGRGTDGPVALESADAAIWNDLGTWWREKSAQKRARDATIDGSFLLWAYQHRGLPSFGCQLWGRPDAPPPALGEPAAASPSAPVTPDAPAIVPPADGGAAPGAGPGRGAGGPPGGSRGGGRGGRFRAGGDAPQRAAGDAGTTASIEPEAAEWLKWLDRAEIDGFADWKSVEHPTMGAVEVGGFRPGVLSEIPADQAEKAASDLKALLTEIAVRLPRLDLGMPVVTTLGPGLYRIDLSLTNTGRFPSLTQMGVVNGIQPTPVIRISVPLERIVSGRPVIRAGALPGLGGREDLSWIVRAEPGELIVVEASMPLTGKQRIQIRDGTVASTPAMLMLPRPASELPKEMP